MSKRIVVVGAGLAGLAAAHALARKGFDVEVVEARSRVGGRLHTVDGIDLGAHWIHGTEGNPITNLARRVGLATVFVGGDPTYTGGWEHLALLESGGLPLPAEAKLRSLLAADDFFEFVEAWRRSHPADASPDRSLGALVDDYCSVRAASREEERSIRWHADLLAREDWAAGVEALSARHWDDGYEVYGYGDSIILGGFQALADALAERVSVRLDCRVARVELPSDGTVGVRLQTSQGTIEADAAIVTLPLGVLKAGTVVFDPPLGSAKQRAIDALGMGSLAKLLLFFDEPFWPRDRYVFGHVPEQGETLPADVVNLFASNGIACLVILVGGDLGRWLERSSLEEATEWGLRFLRRLWGTSVPSPSRVLRTEWSLDPFALGSYSYVAVGSTPADFEALAEPVSDRLFFAGEATDRAHWACAHSAYLSGLREAARISGDESLLPTRHFRENRRWRAQLERLSRFLALRAERLDPVDIGLRLRALEASEVFRGLETTELRYLALMFERRTLGAGERLWREGDPAREVVVIAAGEVSITDSSGEWIRDVGVGAVIGEYAFYVEQRRQADARAKTDSELLVLDYPRFRRFLDAFPSALHALLRITIERFVALERGSRPGPAAGGGKGPALV